MAQHTSASLLIQENADPEVQIPVQRGQRWQGASRQMAGDLHFRTSRRGPCSQCRGVFQPLFACQMRAVA